MENYNGCNPAASTYPLTNEGRCGIWKGNTAGPNTPPNGPCRSSYGLSSPRGTRKEKRILKELPMTSHETQPVEISGTKASGGIKLGTVRYVLGGSLVLAVLAGMIIWNVFAK